MASAIARFGGLFCALLACAVLGGCALTIAGKADPDSPSPATPGNALVFGRINYVIDGKIRTPYSAFRPAWQAPFITAFQLESGDPVQSHAVANEDGSFYWEFPPGHYVISRIGVGTITDDFGTYIPWPRVAFRVPAGERVVYLGHLLLEGTSYSEPYTLSTGTKGTRKGIDYRFRTEDEMESQLPRVAAWTSGARPSRSLFFHDPRMPIGARLVEQWRASRTAVIEHIFGK